MIIAERAARVLGWRCARSDLPRASKNPEKGTKTR